MGSSSEHYPQIPPKCASRSPSRPAVREKFGAVQDSVAVLAVLISPDRRGTSRGRGSRAPICPSALIPPTFNSPLASFAPPPPSFTVSDLPPDPIHLSPFHARTL